MAARLRWTGTRYRDPDTGRYLTRAQVRRELEQSLVNVSKLTDQLADDLRRDRIPVEVWQTEMQDIIKQTQLFAAALAQGGREQMTQADFGRVGGKLREQYRYLRSWASDIKSGDAEPQPGRARQYLRAARTAFMAEDRENMEEQGYDEIRTLLHPADHCADCVSEFDRGWIPVWLHIPIGERQCLSNCRCTVEYRKSKKGAFVVSEEVRAQTRPGAEVSTELQEDITSMFGTEPPPPTSPRAGSVAVGPWHGSVKNFARRLAATKPVGVPEIASDIISSLEAIGKKRGPIKIGPLEGIRGLAHQDGSISLDYLTVGEGLENFLRGERGPSEYGAIRTVIHEALHTVSPLAPGEYTMPYGREIEEAVVERQAREMTAKGWPGQLPDGWRSQQSYEDYVESLDELERVVPGTVDKVWADPTALGRAEKVAEAVHQWVRVEAIPTLRAAGVSTKLLDRIEQRLEVGLNAQALEFYRRDLVARAIEFKGLREWPSPEDAKDIAEWILKRLT